MMKRTSRLFPRLEIVFWCITLSVCILLSGCGDYPRAVSEKKQAELKAAWTALMDFIQSDSAGEKVVVKNRVNGTRVLISPYYGGCCIDGDTMWLYLTEDDGSFDPLLKEYGCIRKKLVKRSWKELQETLDSFIVQYSDLYERYRTEPNACPEAFDNVRYIGVDEYHNCIRVGVKGYSRSWEEKFQKIFTDKAYEAMAFSSETGTYRVLSYSQPSTYSESGVHVLSPEGGGFDSPGVWLGYYKDKYEPWGWN